MRARPAGGASAWKRTPEIIEAIEIVLEHDTAGDPITGLKWTRKTTEKIAEVLPQIHLPVSANTVARLLYQMNFSLRVNRKQIATNSSPYRDQQFQQIASLRTRFQRQGLPIISVDSKKRELIGNFKNAGVKWDRSPVLLNDHDLRSDASGMPKFIRTTSTKTGLVVTADLDRNEYPTHLKPDPQLISSLCLRRGKLLPRWNYTIAQNL